jgi:rhamnosyltransferase
LLDSVKIAGVVVLFNSRNEVLDNIRTYLSDIDILFAVDNSTEKNEHLIGELTCMDKVNYLPVGRNSGVAHALNLGAEKAIAEGFDFIVTMDDDSQAAPNLVSGYKEFLRSRNDVDSIGIISPFHFYKNYTEKVNPEVKEILTAITSGSLINLRCHQNVGPFLEPLFIDYVDFEYCLRLQAHGYRIIRLGSCVLYHALGSMISHKIFFRKVGVTRHSPLRIYYRTRNRLFVAKKFILKFPGFVLKDCVVFMNEMVKILLFEKERMEKFKMVLKGIYDFMSNRLGEYRKA